MRVPRGYRRNDLSPIKGIDTNLCRHLEALTLLSRNDLSPIKGIDTTHLRQYCKNRLWVEMISARLRALASRQKPLRFYFEEKIKNKSDQDPEIGS